jgi:hypothetical protein
MLTMAALMAGCQRSTPAPDSQPSPPPPPSAKPHRKPPPPKAAKLPAVTLPAITAHAPSLPAGNAPTTENPCGTVHVAEGEVPLDCLDPAATQIGDAAQVIVPSTTLNAGKSAPLPERVDHRLDGTEGATRNQGAAGSCTAFSLTAAIDQATHASLGHPAEVSALHLWSRYAVGQMTQAIRTNKDHPLAIESEWPYSAAQANAFANAKKCAAGTLKGADCTNPKATPDLAKEHDADAHPYVTLTNVINVDSASTPALERAIAGGSDIWFCAKIGNHLGCGKNSCNLDKVAGGDDFYIRDFDATKDPGGHCMVLAGYQRTASETYFLIHNSWGVSWGNKGYAFIHEKTFLRNVERGATYIVDASPAGKTPKGHATTQLSTLGCAGTQLRDSITGECEDACPDGSARHDNVCGDSTGCADGEVNVTGHCVSAAPVSHGTEASGVKFTCTASGCTYAIPNGQYGCAAAHCSVTCRAPRYQLANGLSGAVCVP